MLPWAIRYSEVDFLDLSREITPSFISFHKPCSLSVDVPANIKAPWKSVSSVPQQPPPKVLESVVNCITRGSWHPLSSPLLATILHWVLHLGLSQQGGLRKDSQSGDPKHKASIFFLPFSGGPSGEPSDNKVEVLSRSEFTLFVKRRSFQNKL